ncbi:MAG TPA: DUF368 domain-containing protein [Pseudomonadales bacterium]
MRNSRYLPVFLKGIAMGAADIVPGVSGGTIAFISGIYEELIDTLKGIRPALLGTLWRDGMPAFWRAANGSFLLSLLAGIAVSFVLLAHLITHLMEAWPLLLWSFFFGLVLASGLHIGRLLTLRCPLSLLMFMLGLVAAAVITLLPPSHAVPTLPMVFGAGAVAICAMILPGISGSFILLLLGLYGHVIGAIKALDVSVIGVFLLGCVTGLLSFVHLLSWLLHHYRNMTLAMLTGFLLGSLNALWPWKLTTGLIESGSKSVPLQDNVLPWTYTAATGQPAMLLGCLLLLGAGVAIVLLLERLAGKASPGG